MTRLAVTAAMLVTMVSAQVARADEIPDEVQVVADETGHDAIDLLGATLTTGLDARTYECMAEHLLCPPVVQTSYEPVVECIINHESRGNPRAVNPRSGASGLGQFLPSTWRTTPQGKAGMSVFDPVANRAAVSWMIRVGRGREFVGMRGC